MYCHPRRCADAPDDDSAYHHAGNHQARARANLRRQAGGHDGVNGKTYKFVLNDAYVDDPRGIIHWPDVWQLVSQYKPNFNVTGLGEETFAKMQPGETLTVRGMFSGNNQTYEVMGTEPGGGRFAPAQHY